MSIVEQKLSGASFQTIRGHVAYILKQAGLRDVLDPSYVDDPGKLPEFVDIMLRFLCYGTPTNGGTIYFERPDGLTEEEYFALGRVILAIKLALDEELSQMPAVVSRIAFVEDLLKEYRW